MHSAPPMPTLRPGHISIASTLLLASTALVVGCADAEEDSEAPERIQVTWLTRTCDLDYNDEPTEDPVVGNVTVYVGDDEANVPIPEVARAPGTNGYGRQDLPLDGSTLATPGVITSCGISSRFIAKVISTGPFTVEVTNTYEGTRDADCASSPPMPPAACTVVRHIVWPSRLVERVPVEAN